MKRKKFSITLIELMIVILLIGIITGALAFNLSGSLDKGRAFKTEQNIARVKDILMLEYAEGKKKKSEIAEQWQAIVAASPLASNNGANLINDGWNQSLIVTFKKGEGIQVSSAKLIAYKQAHEVPPAPKK